ncbi:36.4 kDa proline-rich protein-like [Glycine soja]|uniref:36.4 kDa proline-rich protein-like n=1 Tax=Glycine soja TaxID=3848 RepID=UPI001038CACE|nr:36.4 kDa proline-rich protein-like [Glycine soja]
MPTDTREIEVVLCIPGRGFILNVKGHPGKILRKDLTTLAQLYARPEEFPPTVLSLKGSRRPRARPAETPSTSAAPHPASTSAAPPPARIAATPSTPPPAEFQHFKAMLRSIHQGQIILLQRTQPPLHRDDEDPVAQVPHQPLDESSESSTPKPLIRKRRVVVTQEAAATPEKSPEATPEPPVPMANTTSPQQAADPSTPEVQTTPVLSPNTSLVATPVLHLTNEEEVQTQDTQDQSQDL